MIVPKEQENKVDFGSASLKTSSQNHSEKNLKYNSLTQNDLGSLRSQENHQKLFQKNKQLLNQRLSPRNKQNVNKSKIQKSIQSKLGQEDLSHLEGLERLQEEVKLSFHKLIKRIIDKIFEIFANFFKKFLPKYLAKYMENKIAKKERAELIKKIQKKKLTLSQKTK